MTGRYEVDLGDTAANVALRRDAESAFIKQSKVSVVFATEAQGGTAATNSCQAASLRSGLKAGTVETDCRI